MAVQVFLTLCGLSVAFLVYVFVQLWREGHQSATGAEPVMLFHRSSNPDLVVVTHPISLNAHGGISVIPLQPQARVPTGQTPERKNARVLEMPARERHCGERRGASGAKIKAR